MSITKDLVPTGGFRQVSDGVEPVPSHVTSDAKRPSCPTSELDSVKGLPTGSTGVVVTGGDGVELVL